MQIDAVGRMGGQEREQGESTKRIANREMKRQNDA